MVTNFDPISAAIGGALIGLATMLLMLLNGRIAGVSGIMAGMFAADGGDRSWRFAFIAGIVLAPLATTVFGTYLQNPVMPLSWIMVIVAGLLVGFGARLAGGCTSGHGICGVARLSVRSIVATVVFMACAIAVVFIARHGWRA
jgi:uncharacterized membrane protein YedE/YeeE